MTYLFQNSGFAADSSRLQDLPKPSTPSKSEPDFGL